MAALPLDACTLINLVASGVPLKEISNAVDCDFVVTTIAAAESLFVFGEGEGDDVVLVSVEGLEERGHLQITTLTELELALYVELARSLDDGEASTLAVARQRNTDVATDDRRAMRVASELGLLVITTSQLLRAWADQTGPTPNALRDAITGVQRRGNFIPARNDPERQWWTQHSP
jgi:predicted nucleic acid-binding protein